MNYRIQVTGIEIVSKSMTQPPKNGVGPVFTFALHAETRVHVKRERLIEFVKMEVKGRPGGEEEPEGELELATLSMSCLFSVEDFQKVIVKNEEGLYVIPPGIEATIRPITISTARGVLYSEFRGTYLNNAVLPIVDMHNTNQLPTSKVPVPKRRKAKK